MNRIGVWLALALLTSFSTGCNSFGRQPRLDHAAIVPASLKPGDSAVITVKVIDKRKIIKRVVGVVQEDPRMKFPLRDDGVAPDKKASDGVWSLQVDVPPLAPPGQFTLALTAFGSKGDAIVVRKTKDETGPLSATCTLLIEYPPEEPQGAEAPEAAAPPG